MEQATSASGGSGGGGEEISITVSDPVKMGSGTLSEHTTYKITTNTSLPQFNYSEFHTIRRYSDFVWLHDELSKEFPGIVIPSLPEKVVMGRFNPITVERRRRALERCLIRIGNHQELRMSDHFKAFLEAKELKTVKELAKQQRKGSTFSSWMSSALSGISGGGNVETPTFPEDADIVSGEKYIAHLEPQLKAAHKACGALIASENASKNALFDYSLQLNLLGAAEGKDTAMGSALTEVHNACGAVNELFAAHVTDEEIRIEEQLKDYVAMVGAMWQAFVGRTSTVSELRSALQTVESKKLNAAKLKGQPGKEEKSAAAEKAVQDAEAACAKALETAKLSSQRVVAEYKRFRSEKAAELRRILLAYAEIQLEFTRRKQAVWEELLPKLRSIPEYPMVLTEGGGASEDGSALAASAPSVTAQPPPAPEDGI